MKKLWKTINTKTIYDYGIVRFKEEKCQHIERDVQHNFFKMEFLDWVNIVAITKEKEIILVKQYRFGTNEVTLELPGGTLDKGESSHQVAARREMLEETGYDNRQKLNFLGKVAVNPAIQNNYCYFYLAQDVELKGKQDLDITEDIELELVPIDKIEELVATGEINHSLSILGLSYAEKFLLG